VQQRVLKYDPSHPVPPEQRRAGENDPLTLHLLLGRSLFIDTADRMRRVYVSNPTVLDSLTASPHQLVITAKAAGSSSVVLWNERGQSNLYTIPWPRRFPVTTSRSRQRKGASTSRVWSAAMRP
jgi:Flp pilus assembly secretin CpaC